MSVKNAQVSPAASNTRVLKNTKKLMKLSVSGVKIAGEHCNVKFIARQTPKGGVVICRTRGQTPMRITCIRSASGKKDAYRVDVRGVGSLSGIKEPAKAFAQGVKSLWATA